MSRVQKVSCELADDREVYMPGEVVNVVVVVLLLYVPSQQLWSLRDGQFT